MTKISRNQKMARASILWNTRITIALIGLGIILILRFVLGVKNPQLMLAIIIGEIALGYLIAIQIIKKGGTGVVLRKWQKQREIQINNYREKRKSLRDQYKTIYKIVKVNFSNSNSLVFEIAFDQNIIKGALPKVNLNGQELVCEYARTDSNVASYRAKSIPNNDELTFSVGKSEYKIVNPYKIIYSNNPIRWQTKGNSVECNIFLNVDIFPNIKEGVSYVFFVKINRNKFGPYLGKYNSKNNTVTIETGRIKANCYENNCVLIPIWTDNGKYILPKPEILSVNNKMRVSDLFPRQQTG